MWMRLLKFLICLQKKYMATCRNFWLAHPRQISDRGWSAQQFVKILQGFSDHLEMSRWNAEMPLHKFSSYISILGICLLVCTLLHCLCPSPPPELYCPTWYSAAFNSQASQEKLYFYLLFKFKPYSIHLMLKISQPNTRDISSTV